MNEARLIQAARDTQNRLRGELFEAVEAVGLPEKQEDAFKGLIRRSSYKAQVELEAAIRR